MILDRETISQAVRAAALSPETLAPDTAARLEFLIWLRQLLAARAIEPSALTATELEELRALEEVSGELQRSLRRCPRCGAATDSLLACTVCGERLTRGLKS